MARADPPLHLPSSASPTLILTPATSEEKVISWNLNASIWRGALSHETYLTREVHLGSQPLTRNSGITYWVLVDSSEDTAGQQRTILASCETLRKRALVARKKSGEIEEVVSHGVGSVFCRGEFRGKGYAGRMMEELGKKLDEWQQESGRKTEFTVLYSDIGKRFYTKNGWRPFPSSHIALSPESNGSTKDDTSEPRDHPKTSPLYAEDLGRLCDIDERLMKKRIVRFAPKDPEVRVALLPDANTMQWHHAREEYFARAMLDRHPDVKGAIVESEDGHRVWCIWTRVFGMKEEENTLHILRLVIEGENDFGGVDLAAMHAVSMRNDSSRINVLAAAAVLRAAQLEAAEWGMYDVQIWNPLATVVLAAREILPNVEIFDREEESIASLRWHSLGEDTMGRIEWVGNEKYGWC